MEYGKEYLKRKLSRKAVRVRTRYRYYEMKNCIENMSQLIPPDFRSITHFGGVAGAVVVRRRRGEITAVFPTDGCGFVVLGECAGQ